MGGREEEEEKELPNVKTEWFNFNIGVNALLDNGSFNMSPANQALELENFAHCFGVVRVRTEPVNGLGRERDYVAGTQRFHRIQNLLLQYASDGHPGMIAGMRRATP